MNVLWWFHPQTISVRSINVTIAPDGRTVGWTEGVDVEDPGDKVCDLPNLHGGHGRIIWRAGEIIRSFPASGPELDWSFAGKGDLVRCTQAQPTSIRNRNGSFTILRVEAN
jgi:hypothetical protein